MGKRLFQTLCFLKIVILIYSAEPGEENIHIRRTYDLDGLIKRTLENFRISSQFQVQNLLDFIHFKSNNEEFMIPLSKDLPENSTKCLADLSYTREHLKEKWALKLIDSIGKPESGILQGNFKWIGDYNECLGVRSYNPNSSTVGNFRGQYCTLTWSLGIENLSLPLSFSNGMCVPDSCSEELEFALQLLHVAGAAPVLNNNSNVVLNVTSFKCKPTERHLNVPAKVVIYILSAFCALSLMGSSITIVKYFKRASSMHTTSIDYASFPRSRLTIEDEHTATKNMESDRRVSLQVDESSSNPNTCCQKIEHILSCFCIFTNGAKILKTDSSEGELLCIHGIRFFSMSWVILGHVYSAGIEYIKNVFELPDLIKNCPFQVVIQGVYSVDTFFVLSGFLLCYLSMKEFSKTEGRISWPYFYIHRYIRLTPIYMITLGFMATVYLYLGSGPFWKDDDVDPICRDSWWRNLIYINNFSDDSTKCMPWAWYLANDMQFFVISPIFLITLWRWPKVGYSLLALFLFGSWTANFYLTYHFNLITGFNDIINDMSSSIPDLSKMTEFSDKIYARPYTRIGPYLIGILTGYVLFRNKAGNRPKHGLVFLSLGWIIASAIALTCVYGLHHTHPSVLARSFYNALSRTGFALGVSWVIYVCLFGQGGFVNSILSFKLFIPLSRLTYSAYLIHPLIVMGYFSSLKTTIAFSHPTMVVLYLGFMVVTYCLSLPVSLILESPIVLLEKFIRKSLARR